MNVANKSTGGMIGILGGMGPMATVDFMTKIIEQTPAQSDQDHLPLIVYSVPQIPDRTRSILGEGESPLPHLLRGLSVLRQAGAACIAMPCNTAHYWFDTLQRESGSVMLHIADAACQSVARQAAPGVGIGLLATSGTVEAGFYQQRLEAAGYACVVPEAQEMSDWVMPGIAAVKQGALEQGGALLETAVASLRRRGAARVLLACTEIPVGLEHIHSLQLPHCVDATRALAEACVFWWQSREDSSRR